MGAAAGGVADSGKHQQLVYWYWYWCHAAGTAIGRMHLLNKWDMFW